MGANNYPKNRWGMPEKQQAAFAKLICNNKKTSVLSYLKPDVFYHLNKDQFSVPMHIPVLITDHIGLKKRRKIFSLKKLLMHLMLLSSLKKFNRNLYNGPGMCYLKIKTIKPRQEKLCL